MDNKIKEPAQSANCTSSTKEKSIYEYDNTEPVICQALKFAKLATELGADITYQSGVFVIEPRVGDNNA
jgi:hypothetical protein